MTIQNINNDHAALTDQIAILWQRMLNRADVPHDANFVKLGGDSLLLLSIMTELEDIFGVELDPEDIIKDLTVNGMAYAVAAATSN